jgi:hypothetical protein
MAVWAQATWCETAGRIGTDLLGRPEVRFTPGAQDMARLRDGLVTLARMHFAAGAREVIPAVHGLPYKLTQDQLSVLEEAPLDPRAYVAILSHLFGGCVMGRDAGDSVCDEQGRVHGAQSLYVADASVIPTGLGVNPQHTIMAIARLFAERMLEQRSSRPTRLESDRKDGTSSSTASCSQTWSSGGASGRCRLGTRAHPASAHATPPLTTVTRRHRCVQPWGISARARWARRRRPGAGRGTRSIASLRRA